MATPTRKYIPVVEAERDEAFESDVAESYPDPVVICGQSFNALDILLQDGGAYAEARRAFVDEGRKEIIDRVCESYPFPIAHLLARYVSGHEHQLERAGFLKDVWEATVTVLFSLMLGEVRASGQVLEDSDVRPSMVESWSIRERIEVLSALRKFGFDVYACSQILNESALAALIKLNRDRNERFAHVATLSETEAREFADELEPHVLNTLSQLSELGNVELMRYVRPGANRTHQVQVFRGASPQKQIQHKALAPNQLAALAQSHMSTEDVFALYRGDCFALSPMMILSPDVRPGALRMEALKKCTGAGADKTLQYELFGASSVRELRGTSHVDELEQLKSLFRSTGKKQKREDR